MIKFLFKLVSHDIYGRYEVLNTTSEGDLQMCGYLDLTDEEFALIKSCLIDGSHRYMSNEVKFEFTAEDSVKAYLEGV